jgi:hypothetical protein
MIIFVWLVVEIRSSSDWLTAICRIILGRNSFRNEEYFERIATSKQDFLIKYKCPSTKSVRIIVRGYLARIFCRIGRSSSKSAFNRIAVTVLLVWSTI